jgi:hypothetical protein
MSNVRRTRFRLALAALPAASALAGCGGHSPAGFCGLVRTGNGFDAVAAVHGLSCGDAMRAIADVERDQGGGWTCSRAMHAAYELDCREPGREVRILESVPVRATRSGDEVRLANWRFRLRAGRLEGRDGAGWVDLGGPPYCVTAAPRPVLVALGLRRTTPSGGCFDVP